MRKTIRFGQLFLLASSLFLFACKKSDAVPEEKVPQSETARKVTAWLDAKLANADIPEKQAKIKALKENVELSKLWTEEFSNGEVFVLVPIKEGLSSAHNAGKQKSSTLSLVINKEGKVRKGRIVQYLPAVGRAALPRGTISSIFNFKPMKHDGTFTFLNIFDKRMEEYAYQDTKLKSWGANDTKQGTAAAGNNQVSSQRTQGLECYHYYWVTTYEDGSQTWEYMYTSCTDDGCRPDEECDAVDPYDGGGGGGGGGGEETVEEFAPHQKAWDVVRQVDGYWVLTSTEEFTGRRTSTSGGTFTTTRHVQDKVFPESQTMVTWGRTEMSNWGETTGTAHARIKGWIQGFGGSLQPVNETHHFPFNSVFY